MYTSYVHCLEVEGQQCDDFNAFGIGNGHETAEQNVRPATLGKCVRFRYCVAVLNMPLLNVTMVRTCPKHKGSRAKVAMSL